MRPPQLRDAVATAMTPIKKKLLATLALTGLLTGGAAQAALQSRANGTMVYDTETNLTWITDATLGGQLSQADAAQWAAGLSFGGFDDWRLPTVAPANGVALDLSYSEDGSTDIGLNIAGKHSELGYLYHVSLGNTSAGLTNAGSFIGLVDPDNALGPVFWTGTTSEPDWGFAFFMGMGAQESLSSVELGQAWAVRVGDVAPVPEPAGVLLMLAGLAAIAARRRFL